MEDLKNTISRARPNANKVIITVYIEIPRNYPSQKIDPTDKSKPKRPKNTRTQGYGRRAELLAYARQLREGCDYKRQEWQPRQKSRPTFKKGKSGSASVRIRGSFQKVFGRNGEEEYRYERIGTYKDSEERQFGKSRKKKAHNFYRKLKSVLKNLSCGLQCGKG